MAVARLALRLAMQTARRDFPSSAEVMKTGLLPSFEPILAGGNALSDAPSAGQSLLLLLDAIQPVGMTTVILDQNNLLPLLGAAAGRNSLLPVQVLESGAFMSLGTIISPVTAAAYGSPVLQARLTYEDGTQAQVDVKQGSIQVLPLPAGQAGKLSIQPAGRADVGFGPGRPANVTVSGGSVGVVFDGRGRPLLLPSDAGRRRELVRSWHWTLGA
jgi:hypothetical protein